MSGETAQALGGPGGQIGGPAPQAQLADKFHGVIAGVREIMQIARRIPGIDQAKLDQAAQSMQQAFQLFSTALPRAGGAPSQGVTPPGPPG